MEIMLENDYSINIKNNKTIIIIIRAIIILSCI